MPRAKLPPDDVRHRRDVRLSNNEWRSVVAAALSAGLPIGVYTRRALCNRRIVARPSASDRAAWVELSRVVSNVNQLSHAVNIAIKSGEFSDAVLSPLPALLEETAAQIAALRAELLGVS